MSAELEEALKCLKFLRDESIKDIAFFKDSVTTKTLYQLYYTDFNIIKQGLIQSQKIEVENVKYKQLEEQIGCPLEIYVGISQHNITEVYDEYGVEYIILLRTIRDQFNACNFTNGLNNILVCEWKNYKKTWWLRKDKSE